MYTKEELMSHIFFDIETKPQDYAVLNPELKRVWLEKYYVKSLEKEMQFLRKQSFLESNEFEELNNKAIKSFDSLSEEKIFNKYAPLYPEFGEVLCICIGVFNEEMKPEIENVLGETEIDLLKNFFTLISTNKTLKLAGYNIKNFDIPFLIRRSYILNQPLPSILRLRGKKPWEMAFLDLAEDYKGSMFEMVSLDLVTSALGVPSPKDEFQNYEVSTLFMEGKVTRKDVIRYCCKDVKANMLACVKLLY